MRVGSRWAAATMLGMVLTAALAVAVAAASAAAHRRDRASSERGDTLEGLAVTADRRVFLATDDDGVDENYGETLLFGPGKARSAFAGWAG